MAITNHHKSSYAKPLPVKAFGAAIQMFGLPNEKSAYHTPQTITEQKPGTLNIQMGIHPTLAAPAGPIPYD